MLLLTNNLSTRCLVEMFPALSLKSNNLESYTNLAKITGVNYSLSSGLQGLSQNFSLSVL